MKEKSFLADRSGLILLLQDRGLLDSLCLVNSDVEFLMADRRNENTIVRINSKEKYFIKQFIGSEKANLYYNEEFFLRSFCGNKELPVSKLVMADDDKKVIVLHHINDATSLSSRYLARKTLRKEIARQLGLALAQIHSHQWPGHPKNGKTWTPWSYNLYAPLIDTLEDISPAAMTLLSFLQNPDLSSAFEKLETSWQPNCMVHGDIKFDNIMVKNNRPYKVTLVDWETVNLGDPAWDVGSVIGDILNHWVMSMAAKDDMNTEDIQATAKRPLTKTLPFVRLFLDTYCSVAKCDNPEFLIRSVANAGVRTLQFAYEGVQKLPSISPTTALQMQLGANILVNPEDAAVRLLEIGIQ